MLEAATLGYSSYSIDDEDNLWIPIGAAKPTKAPKVLAHIQGFKSPKDPKSPRRVTLLYNTRSIVHIANDRALLTSYKAFKPKEATPILTAAG